MSNGMIIFLMFIGGIALMFLAYHFAAGRNREFAAKQRKNLEKLEQKNCPECGRPMKIGFLATRGGARFATSENLDKSFGRLKPLGGILPAGICQACQCGVFLVPKETKTK
jgi:hypothetical protein